MNRSAPRAPSAYRPAPARRRRALFVVPVLLLAVVVAMVAAAPAALSTAWGRDAVLGWVNDAIPGQIRADDLSLSWLGGQSVRGLAIHDPSGQPVLELEAFTTELTLLDALRRRLSLGQTVIRGLNADLRFDAAGVNNLSTALGGGADDTGEEAGGLFVPVTGNMALIDGRISMTAPGIDPIVLESLSGAVEMTDTTAPIKVSFGGISHQGDLAGSITVNGQVSSLLTEGRLTPAGAHADVQASVKDLPVEAVDRLLRLRGVLSAALGPSASLELEASGGADRQTVSLAVSAANGELSLAGSVAAGRFDLSQPASARLTVTPALIDLISRLRAGDGEPALRLVAEVPLHLTVEQLSAPLDTVDLSQVSLRAGLDARTPIRLSGLADIGEASVNDLRLVVDSRGLGDTARLTLHGVPVTRGQSGKLAVNAEVGNLVDGQGVFQPGAATVRIESRLTGVPTSLLDAALQQDGLLVEAVGPVLSVSLDADTTETGHVDASLSIDSARLDGGPVRFRIDENVALSEPARLRFQVSPGLWERLFGGAPPMQLTEASTWTLELIAFRSPLPTGDGPAFRPEETALHATLNASAMALHDAEIAAVGIEHLKLELTADAMDALDIEVLATLVQPGGTLASLNASPLRVALTARSGLETDATLKPVSSTLMLDSEGLTTTLKANIDPGFTRLELAEPATIDTRLTPGLLAATADQDQAVARLLEAANLRATIERLVVPLVPFSYAYLTAQGGMRLDPLVIETAGGVSSTIEGSEATFRFDGAGGGRAELALSGRVRPVAGEPGELSLDLTAGNLVNKAGQIDGEDLSLTVDGRLQSLPSALLDQLLGMDGIAAATLGATTNLAVHTELDEGSGPVSLTLDAANARSDIKARIDDDGLTLSEPLRAQFEPTPEFGQKVLSKVHPIFETTQRAEQPIRLEVPSDGVRIPIEDYAFEKITVPSMTLDFGRIVLKSGWLLRGIVGLGQQFGRLENVQREEWVAWFTPAQLQIRGGEIQYARRLDLLLDQRLHLATWGSADVARDRSNLTLAFMPGTMERVFSITVADNDALRIPITGPLSGPSIDFEKTAADLARLRAQEEVAGENPLAGLLLGSVAGKVTGGGPVPPPSVSPLPWAELLREQEATRQSETGSAPAQQQSQPARPAEQRQPSTEEQVIKGLIDIFGKKKNGN